MLVLRRHIVEAGNPLEVGDAQVTQVNRRGLLALEHLHPVEHGSLVAATRGAGRALQKKNFIEETPGYARAGSLLEKIRGTERSNSVLAEA